MLTVVCWKWDGYNAIYRARHVNRLEEMLRATMAEPFRLLCITDSPGGINCETAPIWGESSIIRTDGPLSVPEHIRSDHGIFGNCFHRMRLFDPRVAERIGKRILSIDLDSVIQDDVSCLIEPGRFNALANKVAIYNGSMWYLEPGMHPRVWADFAADPARAIDICRRLVIRDPETGRRQKVIGSDQAWMSYCIPKHEARLWDAANDGCYFYRSFQGFNVDPTGMRAVFFAGQHKPWDDYVRQRTPLLYNRYVHGNFAGDGSGNADYRGPLTPFGGPQADAWRERERYA